MGFLQWSTHKGKFIFNISLIGNMVWDFSNGQLIKVNLYLTDLLLETWCGISPMVNS